MTDTKSMTKKNKKQDAPKLLENKAVCLALGIHDDGHKKY